MVHSFIYATERYFLRFIAFFGVKMSDTDEYMSSDTSSSMQDESDSDEIEVIGLVEPYANEPPAHSSDDDEDDEEDSDGLSPAVLRARFERQVAVNEWCICKECKIDHLSGALEYRCCREIAQASQKLTFDGSIERVSCITNHDDFSSMTNRSVLLQVGPLLRDKNGRGYRRRDGQTETQFLRAVSYRWLVRWICGYMGWDNTRPLPACVYHNIRQRFLTEQIRGYQTAQQRD